VYDKKVDELIGSIVMEGEKSTLEFSVYSYNKGKPKFQITRTIEKEDGSNTFMKVGRMSKDELEFLLSHREEIIKLFKKGADMDD